MSRLAESTVTSCMFKHCKARFKSVMALRAHWSVDHDCAYSGCEVKSKNAGAGKEHHRDRHDRQCHVLCEGQNHFIPLGFCC
jgi:hypothetical protein